MSLDEKPGVSFTKFLTVSCSADVRTSKRLWHIEGPRYEPREIAVVDTRGKQSKAWTFLAKDAEKRTAVATSAAYVSWIVYGLRQNGASEDYISHVVEVARETNRHARQDATEQNRLIDNI